MISTPAVDDEAGNRQVTDAPLQVLLRLASTAELYRSTDGGLDARVPIGNRHEIYGIRSGGFRDWLINGYFAEPHGATFDVVNRTGGEPARGQGAV